MGKTVRKKCELIADDAAAEIIRTPGIVVMPRKLKTPGWPEVIYVHLGWAMVSVPLREGMTPRCSLVKPSGEYVRWKESGRQRLRKFWHGGDRFSPEYYVEFVKACGVPTIEDFMGRLITTDGGDLLQEAENSAAKRARRKQIPYEMDSGWMKKLYTDQRGLCALSRLPMYRENGKLCHKIPVPDRIDSAGGYVPGNVRLLRHGINMMRRDMDDETFITACASVLEAAG